jgi:hypothetical protein
MNICQQLLRYERDGDELLCNIVIGLSDKVKIAVRCGSVNNSWNYLNVGESVQTTQVFTLRSNCVKLQNKVQESSHFCFNELSIPVTEKRSGGITFQHTFIRSLNVKFCLNKMFINMCKFTECNAEHSEIALLNKFQYK